MSHMRKCYGEIEELLGRKNDLRNYKRMMTTFDNLFTKTKTMKAKALEIPAELMEDLDDMKARFPDLTTAK